MKTLKISTFLLLATCFIQASRVSPDPVTFVGSTPCDMIPRNMLSIPINADCEFIKWNLALRRDPRNQAPTTFRLSYTYGLTQPNTTGFRNNGTSQTKEGNWSIRKDASNKETYRLNATTPETSITFARLDDNLIHLLDSQGKLMIGHAGWSYTLNRK
ncbi:hypothetical protein [Spirosoma sp.]|uniref:hypothetical protein n=1 Tax=Spirosoma sp. TaxID=1899569 RepID=UPI003B3B7D32